MANERFQSDIGLSRGPLGSAPTHPAFRAGTRVRLFKPRAHRFLIPTNECCRALREALGEAFFRHGFPLQAPSSTFVSQSFKTAASRLLTMVEGFVCFSRFFVLQLSCSLEELESSPFLCNLKSGIRCTLVSPRCFEWSSKPLRFGLLFPPSLDTTTSAWPLYRLKVSFTCRLHVFPLGKIHPSFPK